MAPKKFAAMPPLDVVDNFQLAKKHLDNSSSVTHCSYIVIIGFSSPSIWIGKLALAATAPSEEGTLHVEIRDTDITSRQNTNEALVGGEETLRRRRAARAPAGGAGGVACTDVDASSPPYSATIAELGAVPLYAHLPNSQVPESLLRRIEYALTLAFRYHVGFV